MLINVDPSILFMMITGTVKDGKEERILICEEWTKLILMKESVNDERGREWRLLLLLFRGAGNSRLSLLNNSIPFSSLKERQRWVPI